MSSRTSSPTSTARRRWGHRFPGSDGAGPTTISASPALSTAFQACIKRTSMPAGSASWSATAGCPIPASSRSWKPTTAFRSATGGRRPTISSLSTRLTIAIGVQCRSSARGCEPSSNSAANQSVFPTSQEPAFPLLHRLPRLNAHLFRDPRDDAALLVDRRGELGRPPWADQLAGAQKARPDGWIAGDLADVGGNPLANVFGHVAGAEQANQAVECQRRKARLLDGRDGRLIGDMHAIADGEDLGFAGLHMGPHNRKRSPIKLDAPLTDVGGGLNGVAIGHFGHFEIGFPQERGEKKIADSSRGCPVEPARLLAHEAHQLSERADLQARRRRDD